MTPRATYRLQFHKDFGFAAATEVASYLAALGVTHIYASPWLKARPGSMHGYDIVDHHALNSELGTEADFEGMIAAFQANGLRVILDFVPNHMGVGGSDNPLWLDVLEWGPNSSYAGWFDIDWQSDRFYLRDKLLVPFLSDQYGLELTGGKLILKFDEQEGSFAVWAYDSHKLPVCPIHYGRILGGTHPELERLSDLFANLPEWRSQVGQRARELKAILALTSVNSGELHEAIAAAVSAFNGIEGEEASWTKLNALIQDQHWRVANFRVAGDDINYRRFFNVNDLAGLRMELPDVFESAHTLVFRLLAAGVVDGLRIDHVDGLLNPKEYFQRLRASTGATFREPFYLIVEKILARHESLREDWAVDGTTGYEFSNLVLGIVIDPAGEQGFTRTYIDFTGQSSDFADVVRDCKLRIMRNEMVSELNVLAREAARVARQNGNTTDFTHNVLRRAIRATLACFPVYRTYVDFESSPSDEDRRDLDWAIKQARSKENELDPSVFDFLAKLLSGDLVAQSGSGYSRYAVLHLAMKLQQYSSAVMAKGLEDTAFYRYNRFVALNEVGGHPDRFGLSFTTFDKANIQRAERWPKSMLSTSTHDTKRGEDTRARLAVLSELPEEWTKLVHNWSRILRARMGDVEGTAPPDRNDEYLFYQLLIGTWPAELSGSGATLDSTALANYADRLKRAITKCLREAKVRSTWVAPNAAYEAAVLRFVDSALNVEESNAFLASFLPFQSRIAELGVRNSLFQTTLKLTVPGIPDIYQGAELWDLSLMDPDNRRPVDFEARATLLSRMSQKTSEAGATTPKDLLRNWTDGAIKLFIISRLLALRSAEPEVFSHGTYTPLVIEGPKADRLCAFIRQYKNRTVLVVAARFPVQSAADSDWCNTSIVFKPQDGPELYDIFTRAGMPLLNGAIDPRVALEHLPVAVFAPRREKD